MLQQLQQHHHHQQQQQQRQRRQHRQSPFPLNTVSRFFLLFLLLVGQFDARSSARVAGSLPTNNTATTTTTPTPSLWSTGGRGGGGGVGGGGGGGGGVRGEEEEEGGSLMDRSAQIIKQQDAEEGERWEETVWSPRTATEGKKNDTLCPKPLPPENGFVRGTDYNDGGVVHIVCEEGYRLQGPDKLTCTPVPYPGAPGVWLPQDEYRCLRSGPSVIEIRSLDGSSDEVGPSYVILHDSGLRQQGTHEDLPDEENQASVETVECSKPTPPLHGSLQGADYSLYATVRVTCDEGYSLIGPDHLTCLPVPDPFHRVGIWEPQQVPVCHAAPPSTLPFRLVQGLTLVTRKVSFHRQSSHRLTDTLPDATQPEGLPLKCSLPKIVGPCRAAIPRYYFNTTMMECLPFTYGGCDGNDNNFHTFSECQTSCH